jgi:hypothetical protein
MRNKDCGGVHDGKSSGSQEKWNLDDKTCKQQISKSSKFHLLSVAKDIGLEVEDGNPDLVDKMLKLDCSRNAASLNSYSHDDCSKASSSSVGISDFSILDVTSDRPRTPDPVKDGHPLTQVTDQEKGWSQVGNRNDRFNLEYKGFRENRKNTCIGE